MLASEASTREAMNDIKAALGERPVDLLLTRCQLVNVCSGEIQQTRVAIRGARIVAIRADFEGDAAQTIDCRNQFLIPGYIEPRVAGDLLASDVMMLVQMGVTSVIVQPGDEPPANCSGSEVPRIFQECAGTVPPPSARIVRGIQPGRICVRPDDLVEALRGGDTAILERPADRAEYDAALNMIGKLGRDSSSLVLRQFGSPNGRGGGRFVLADLVIAGIDVMEAVRMTGFNAAVHYGLDHEVGSIVPGRLADILVYRNLTDGRPSMVIRGGQVMTTAG